MNFKKLFLILTITIVFTSAQEFHPAFCAGALGLTGYALGVAGVFAFNFFTLRLFDPEEHSKIETEMLVGGLFFGGWGGVLGYKACED